ncbi:MAG: NAD(P)-dependent oxidoreductase [Desulfobacterales bacterium]
MRALVTGGAGFIGSYLIPELLRRGFEVVAFDMAGDPAALASVHDKITYVQGDLSSGPELYRVMMTEQITDVFHLGSILAGPCEENPRRGFQVNFESTLSLLEASVALAVKRVIMLSSISVFGRDVGEPVADDAIKNPETIYGQTKLASEHLLRWYHRNCRLDTRALRFTWVFGPGRTRGITALWSSNILDAVARGESLVVPNPDETGDWLYVKDAVRAIMMLYDSQNPAQRIYNIAGGVHSIREVVNIACKLKPGAAIKLIEDGGRQSPYPAAYDDGPARREIGWQPSYTIENAVKEHLESISNR